jgi:EmrB/QacA subfamily drug resistance transporter
MPEAGPLRILKRMDRTPRLVLAVAILASFISIMDGFIVNVALPAISHDLGGGLALQQWVVDAYLITLGALMLIAGSLSDLFGRKRVLQAGLAIFLITSLLCAAAPNGPLLVLFRALQGLGGALIVPSSLALIIANFSGPAQGKAIGSWTGWTGIAALVAPFLGGLIIDNLSWPVIFLANVPPLLCTMWVLHRLDVGTETRSSVPLDLRGAVSGAIGLGSTVYALIEQAHYGWSHPLIYGSFGLGLASLSYFIHYEQRAKHPMLPMGLFRARNFSVGNAATVLIYAGLAVSSFLITIFVQQYGGYTALEAGLTGVPVTIILFILASRFGGWAATYGPRWFMGFGPIVSAAGFLLMLSVDESVNYWTQLLPGMIVFGLGLAATVAPLTSAVLGCISAKQAGIGSAINNAIARIAGLLAIASVGLVTGAGALSLQGFKRGLIFIVVLLAGGGIISLLGIQNNAKKLAPVKGVPQQ